MLKRSILFCVALAMLGTLPACFLSPEKPNDDGPPPPAASYKDLTERDHVLYNLRLAYNRREIEPYLKLLDTHFIFFFADGDVAGGTVPESWGIDEEERATGNMFDRNYPGPNPIQSITLNLAIDNLQWVAVSSDDPAYPGETWYQTVVAYDYTIQASPDITYVVTANPKVQFFVREFDDNGVTQWRLVRWRDLSSG